MAQTKVVWDIPHVARTAGGPRASVPTTRAGRLLLS